MSTDATASADQVEAPVAESRARVHRAEQRAVSVARLMSAASGLAATIAATEELAQQRAEIISPRARGRRVLNGRDGRDIVSLSEAARRTGRHPEVLRRWCSEGRIPAVRVGRTWALTSETVATLLQHSARSRPRLPGPNTI